MAHFYKNDTTTVGESLIADAIAKEGVFTPTRIVVGSGDIPEGIEPKDMTALVSQKKSLPINKKEREEWEVTAIIGAAFTNEGIEEGFWFKEIGVYAKVVYANDIESEEVLYSYGNAGELGDYIAAYSQNTLVEFQINVNIYIGAETEISVELKSDVYVPVEDFRNHKHDVEDIISGTLPIERGGTGESTLEAAKDSLGITDIERELNYQEDYIARSECEIQGDPNDPEWKLVQLSSELVFLFGATTITPSAALTGTIKRVKLPIPVQNKVCYINSASNDQVNTMSLGAYEDPSDDNYINIHVFASNTTERKVSLCVVGTLGME